MKTSTLFLLLTFAATSSPAYEGVVKAYTGRVLYRAAKAEGFLPIKKNQKLSPNDQIRTDKNGRVQFTFKSGATVLVKENAHVTVKSDRVGDKVAFLRGEFLIGLRQKLKQGRTFEVRTPACVAAVRGTVFWGLSDEKKTSSYACLAGLITVTAQGKTATLIPGQKLKVAFGKTPGDIAPVQIPLDYVNTFAVDGNTQDLKELLIRRAEEEALPLVPETPGKKAPSLSPSETNGMKEIHEQSEEDRDPF